MLLEKTQYKNLRNSHYAQFIQKYWHEWLLSPSAQVVWTTQKTATTFMFGGSLALDSAQTMPLSLLSLSELELSKYSLTYSLPVPSCGRYHGE